MSKPATRAPSPARPKATARPCPCAAPVMNATFPSKERLGGDALALPSWKSRAMLHGCCGFFVAVFVQVFIQVHFQHIVDDVGSHHQSRESGQRDDLWRAEETGQLLVKLIGDAVSMLGQCPAKLH